MDDLFGALIFILSTTRPPQASQPRCDATAPPLWTRDSRWLAGSPVGLPYALRPARASGATGDLCCHAFVYCASHLGDGLLTCTCSGRALS
ncbi:hypothetical protein OAO87_02530 [bacterium]|nr:hypothetical protein [bacterium]